jgi:hypothetical protein
MATFSLDPGSGATARGRVDTVPFQVATTSRAVPDAPTANRGSDNKNQILITTIGINSGGLSHSNGSGRAKIFKGNGDLVAYSVSVGLPQLGTALVAPANEVSFSFPGSGSSQGILSGGVGYRFGLLGTGQASILFGRRANASYSIDLNGFSVSASSNFTDNQGRIFSSHAMMGTATYIMAPSAPNTPTLSSVSTSSISFSIGSLTGTNGDSAITGYRVEYKDSGSTTWSEAISSTTSTSITVSGLAAGTTYDFRVAALNAATAAFGNYGDFSGTLTATTTAAAPVWTDNTLAAFNANIPYSDAVSASNANQYSVSAGDLPSGIDLNSNGTITGTPTVAQESYSFTLRATNTTNGLFISQAFSGTVGGSDQPIKVYVGGSYPGNVNGWINGTVRVFNGSDWVTPIIKVYNGVSWVTPAS